MSDSRWEEDADQYSYDGDTPMIFARADDVATAAIDVDEGMSEEGASDEDQQSLAHSASAKGTRSSCSRSRSSRHSLSPR